MNNASKWLVGTCIDLTNGAISYKITNDSYPGEEYHFATNWGAMTAVRIFNQSDKPIDPWLNIDHSNILQGYKTWKDQQFIMLDQNLVQAALTRALIGDKVGGLKLMSPGSIKLDKIRQKIDKIRDKFNDFCYILVYGTGNTND